MKKVLVVLFAVLLAVVFASPVFSAISTPVVRINLTKTVVITKEQLSAALAEYRQSYPDIDEAVVLDAMVSDEILFQAMERDGYVMAADQQDALLAAEKAQIEAQLGQSLSDDDFAYVIQYYYGATVEEYKQYIVQQYLVQSYVTNMKGDMFTSEAVLPTVSEVESFYRANMASFVSAENVKLSHIFFKYGEDRAASLKKATDVANQIKKGSITFEKAVSQYSEDTDSIATAGDIGWLTIDDTDTKAYMGENFFNEVFKLDAGEVSGVIESYAGYHIVKVSVHNDTRILGINDTITPVDTVTVRNYIENYIYEAKVNEVFQNAYASLIADLKSQASIKYL